MNYFEQQESHKLIEKLVNRLGYMEVITFLHSLDEYTDDLSPKQLARVLRGMIITDEDDIDGG